MVTHIARAGLVAVLLVVPVQLQAELKFTLHMELNRTRAGSPDELSALAAQLASQMFPPGGVDQIVITGDTAMRMEQKQAFAGMPAGTITLFRAGVQFGIDPSAKTFWKQPTPPTEEALQMLSGAKPDIKVNRSGEFETISGMRAERVTTTVTIAMPNERWGMPPGFPSELVATLDVWVTDAITPPASWMPMVDQKLLAQLGLAHLKDFSDNRFMLKALFRVNVLSGMELVMSVKDITNEDVPDSVFEIPAGYKEVPPPTGRGGVGE